MQVMTSYAASMLAWDDLRFARAVAQHGTLAGAARALRVDATTVGRRVAALEHVLGVPVFVRAPSGWRPTEAGERVLEAAELAATAIGQAERIAEEGLAPRGIVRVTAMESVASMLLAPILPSFVMKYPDIRVDVVSTERTLVLGQEADIALRIGRPTRGDLIARRLATVRERLYASVGWLAARGLEANDVRSLEGLPVLSVGGRPWDPLEGLGAYREVLRSNSVTVVAQAVRQGVGIALLPNLVARDLGLVPLRGLPSREELPLWLVTHRDLARIPRVRVLFDAIAESADRAPTE